MSERLRLKNPSQQFPRDGFGFVDPRTHKTFPGYEGTPAMQAVKIIAHRHANPTIYPAGEGQWFNQMEVIQEVYRQKQLTMPELFVGYDALPVAPSVPYQPQSLSPAGMTCSCGSSSFKPSYCLTCGGNKINGWICNNCGKTR